MGITASACKVERGDIGAVSVNAITVTCRSDVWKRNGSRKSGEAKEDIKINAVLPRSNVFRVWLKNPENGMEHHGVLLEGGYRVKMKGWGKKVYKYAVMHILRLSTFEGTSKFDFFFTNNYVAALERVYSLLGDYSKMRTHVDPHGQSSVSFAVVAEEVKTMLGKTFYDYPDGAKKAAEGHYDQVNCAIAATRLLAVLKGKNPVEAVKANMAAVRGETVRFAAQHGAPVREIVATDSHAWKDIGEFTNASGARYKMQQHAFAGDRLVSFVRQAMPSEPTYMDFRIIVRRKGMGQTYVGHEPSRQADEWRMIVTGSRNEVQKKWEELNDRGVVVPHHAANHQVGCGKCRMGHTLDRTTPAQRASRNLSIVCDSCGDSVKDTAPSYGCRVCDYDECTICNANGRTESFSQRVVGAVRAGMLRKSYGSTLGRTPQ